MDGVALELHPDSVFRYRRYLDRYFDTDTEGLFRYRYSVLTYD